MAEDSSRRVSSEASAGIRFERVSVVHAGPAGAQVYALRELSLEVQPGETLCLIGESGAGKTTALRVVNRLQEPTSGCIRIGERDVRELDLIRLRRGMGYLVQSGGLFPHLTIRENVGLLAELEGWSDERVRARVFELLELVHLDPTSFAERYPDELSGGQRQRVGVARALILDPPIVLLDEPFGALDPITRRALHEEFLELRRAVGKTMLLVSHDLREAFRLGDRVALLRGGELVQVGTRDEFLETPADEHVAEFVRGALDA